MAGCMRRCQVAPARRQPPASAAELRNAGHGLELRGSGLWVDLQCLVPFDHMTVGLEAFAIHLDDPSEALGRLWGERVPFGLDLEWDTTGRLLTPASGASAQLQSYEFACRVHGDVLVGDERIELDGFGSRRHAWGAAHPWTAPWSRVVTADGPVPGDSHDGAALAEAPLLVRTADGTIRVDRSLALVHPSHPGDAGTLAWIERNRPC